MNASIHLLDLVFANQVSILMYEFMYSLSTPY
jgi:hypothetical protein